MEEKNILVTGGAGYIGSHAALMLAENNCNVVCIDNLSNGSPIAISRASDIAKKEIKFIKGDVSDESLLISILKENNIDAVMHFAGLKAVGESNNFPIQYYENNIGGSISLLKAMSEAKIYRLIFSSSATVYGLNKRMPLAEDYPINATNPYGQTKQMIEQILKDTSNSNSKWSIGILRYFNPIGAHQSGLIGEDPKGIPANIVPFIMQVALGKRDSLSIYGKDYQTKDGTGVRDFIHVLDLVEGHINALHYIFNNRGTSIWNLGSGRGYSVLDLVKVTEEVTGSAIKTDFTERRPGDVAISLADTKKAHDDLGWSAKLGIYDMIKDSWRWQQLNPNGYED